VDLYRLLVDSVEDYAIFALDPVGRVLTWNAGARALKGYDAGEILGRTIDAFYTRDDRSTDRPQRHLREAAAHGRVDDEGWRVRKDGSRFWASVVITALRDDEGVLVGYAKVTRDVTARREADQAALEHVRRLAVEESARRNAEARAQELRMLTEQLEEQAEQLEEQAVELEHQVEEAREHADRLALLDAAVRESGEGITISAVDASTGAPRIVFANPAFARMTGYALDEIVGATTELFEGPRTDRVLQRASRERLAGGRASAGRATLHRKDGTPLEIEWEAAPVHSDGDGGRRRGATTHVVSIMRDVTGRLQLEEQYRQAQKMEAVGRLAGGIAHDFNNLLTVISGNCQFLLRDLASDDPRRQDAAEIRDAAARAAALTRQLLAFSRQQPLARRDVDLNDVVRGAAALLRRVLTEDVELVLRLAPELPPVLADMGQLEQVLMNLAVNARDAMPGGGRLELETGTSDEGDAVALRVSDTGVGMDDATQARIFEPFFTTKALGRGTGLGLAMVYGVVRQLGGAVRVRSAPGAGTHFELTFPRAAATDGAAQRPDADVPALGRGEQVLLVEDEDALRRVARRVLTGASYAVADAADGLDALAIAERLPQLQLLVTDVVMPGIRGSLLAARLRARFPSLRVLYISGYTDDVSVERERTERGTAFLQKPFDEVALTRAVRALLDG
jgi:PAS domain S-box-containing protein